MTTTITVRHHFSAGHRIMGLDGPAAKCANPHGHTFVVLATWAQDAAMVEFGAAKAALRGWVTDYLDHGFLVGAEDTTMLQFLRGNVMKHHVFPAWPTTEAVARAIADAMRDRLPRSRLVQVEVQEGPDNTATYVVPL